jgi:hypothetical protein
MKPGIQTSEFVITVCLFLLALAMYVIDAYAWGGTIPGQIIAGTVAIVSALGYTLPRVSLKKRELEGQTLALLSSKSKTSTGAAPRDPS